jgi:diketogulonate reductase-like aldo/keto reductase
MVARDAARRFELGTLESSVAVLNTGRPMPALGLGVFRTPPGRPTRDAVRVALETGYRHIDTARAYRNEADVGAAVRESGIPREEVFITTKLWNDDQGFDSGLAAFGKSRAALGVDYVDLYLIHWPVQGRRLESWKALTRLLNEGNVRSIGVSNFTVDHLRELLRQSDVVPSVNQVEFSPFLYQRELLEFCNGHRIQLEAYSPLTKGERFHDPTLSGLAKARGVSPAQILIRWGLQHAVVEIPKSVDAGRIRENASVFDFALTPGEMERLDDLDEGFRTSWDPTKIP